MVSIPGVSQPVMWSAFIALVFLFLFLDLKVFNRKMHEPSIKEALGWSVFWISIALMFNVFVWFEFGHESAMQFLGGYILEKALSVDNLFVIFLVFASFKIQPKYQHRILFWGIIGALFMRGILIILGSALVAKFSWLFYIFGFFLVYSGVNLFSKEDDKFEAEESGIVKFARKILPISKNDHGGKFIVVENGKRLATVLLIALIVVEFTDLIFAVDSIPAIFGITTDPFIVFTSNIFAILGLRSLYFLIAKLHDSFIFLKEGLSAVLIFIGVKMIFMDFAHMNIILSLAIIFTLLGISIVFSIIYGPRFGPHTEEEIKKLTKKRKKTPKSNS